MFAWVIAGSLVVGAPALKDGRKSVEPPAGEWLEVDSTNVLNDGRDSPRELRGSRIWQFTADTRRVALSDGRAPVTQRAAYADNGGTLEAEFTVFGGQVVKAIWKVDGNTLTICEGPAGGARPTDFTAAKGSGRLLFVLNRIRK